MEDESKNPNHPNVNKGNAWFEVDLNSESEEDIEQTPVQPFDSPENSLSEESQNRERENENNAGGGDNDNSGMQMEHANDEVSHDKYFKTYLDALYYLGLSPVKSDGDTLKGWQRIKLIPFVLLNFISLLHLFFQMKAIWIETAAERGLDDYIYVFYAAILFLYRNYFTYLITKNIDDILRLLAVLGGNNCGTKRKKITPVITALLTTSIVLATIFPFLLVSSYYAEWDMEDFILHQASEMAEKVFLWEHDPNKTNLLWLSYGENVTIQTMSFGVTGYIIQVTGRLHSFLINDVTIIAAISLYSWTKAFDEMLKPLSKEPSDVDTCHEIWTMYKRTQQASKALDSTFGNLFQFIHVENLLYCAHALYSNVILGQNRNLTAVQVIRISKMVCFYTIATKSSMINDKFRGWIHSEFVGIHTLFIENGEVVSTIHVLDKLSSHPIGIGSDMFLITKSFISKLTSMVGSVFCFFHNPAGG